MLFGILTQQAGAGPEPPVEAVEILALGTNAAPNLQTYEVQGQTVTRYVGADVDPGSSPWTCRFSPDGMYLVAGVAASPYIYLYERNGTSFTKAPDPASLPEGQVNGVAFSPDGSFLVASLSVAPYIAIYEINNGVLSKLSNPASVPTGTARNVAFSPDGSLVVIAHTNSPFVTIYAVSGTSLTKLANPTTLPPGNAWGASFSPDGNTLVIGSGTSPYLTAYSVSGQTFTAGPGPDVAPTGYVLSVRFSSDGSYLLAGHVNSPFITKYLVNGAALTKDGSPNPNTGGTVYDIAFNSDESLMFAGSVTAPYLQVYENVGGVFTKIGTADTPPGGTVVSLTYGSFGVDPLFIHYTMDTISGNILTDEQGNYDGTISLAVQRAGYTGNALEFDADSDHVAVAPGVDVSEGGDWSATFLVEASRLAELADGDLSGLFSKNPEGTAPANDSRVYFYSKANGWNSRVGGLGSQDAQFNSVDLDYYFVDAGWVFCSLVRRRSDNTLKAYINGALHGSITLTGDDGIDGLTVGNMRGTSGSWFGKPRALLDDFKFYQKALTASEIASLKTEYFGADYTDDHGADILLDFDRRSAGTPDFDAFVFDSMWRYGGRVIGNPSFVPGVVGDAIEFVNALDRVAFMTRFPVLENYSFTVSGWFELNPALVEGTDWSVLFGINTVFGASYTSRAALYVSIPNSSTSMTPGIGLHFALWDDSSAIDFVEEIIDLRGTGWHHFAVSIDVVTNEVSLYRNGVLVASKISIQFTGGLNGFTLGSVTTNGQTPANFPPPGKLDQFRVHKSVLTQAEIQAIYNAEVPNTGDPYSSNVISLLHFEGPDASTEITDVTGREWVCENGAQLSTTSPISGSSSAVFTGSGVHTTTGETCVVAPFSPDYDFGSDDFTVELFLRLDAAPQSTAYFIGVYDYVGVNCRSWALRVDNDRTIRGVWSLLGTDFNSFVTTEALALGVDTHIAYVRQGTELKLYMNGVLAGTATVNGPLFPANTELCIGAAANTRQNGFNGRIDEVRITKGVARYTENFNPPATPLPDPDPITPASGPVVSLVHFNGADGSSVIVDEMNKPWTANNGAQLSATDPIFGTASLSLTGGASSAPCATTPSSEDFQFGEGDFTIEFFAKRLVDTGGTEALIAQGVSGAFVFNVFYSDTSSTTLLSLYENGTTLVQLSGSGAWGVGVTRHVAITRRLGTVRLFLNGILMDTDSFTGWFNSNEPLTLGAFGSQSSGWAGLIDELRITKGVARYTTNFTSPSEPFPDPDQSVFAHVVSQLHFNGNFTDVKGHTWTVYGGAYLETADPIDGSGSLRPTSSGGIVATDLPELELGSQDFTIEFFAKQLSVSGSTFVEKRGVLGDRAFSILYSTTVGQVIFNYYEDGSNLKQARSRVFTWANGEVRHIAVVCVSGVITVYVDGLLGDGVTNTVTAIYDATEPLRIGVNPQFTQTNTHLIDEFRLVKGIGVYKSDFTVPSMPFPDE